jgi:hypothetical protein
MHPLLEQQLGEIRRRARQTVWAQGLCWGALVLVGSLLAAGFGDWALHFDDAGVRVILALAILGGAGWVIYRRLFVPLQVPLGNLDVALRVEERYPGFKDSLASTVQFLEGKADPRIGSPVLQRAVIERTLSQIGTLDFHDVVETREARRMALAAGCVCLVAMTVAGLNLSHTSLALQRLMFPFSAPAWPRDTNLRLLNSDLKPLEMKEGEPLRISTGDRLRLYAENTTGRLPSKIVLEYKADGRVASETMRPTSLNDSSGTMRELAVGEIPSARQEVAFRAVGGDHRDMPWFRVLVIPPPVIETIRVTLTHPRYLNRPAERLPEGVGHVQGYLGTRVDVEATANKPLKSAALRIRDQERRPAIIAADGKRLSASFVIAEVGIHSYRFDLTDEQGFEDPDPPRYEIRGIQDLEPEVRIEAPAADMQVTAEAEVLVRAVARDDLGLKELRLQFKPDWSDAGTIPLFGGPAVPMQHAAEHVWKIAELKPAAGGRIVFHAEATDEFELKSDLGIGAAATAPHIGRSTSRTLTIVSAEEKSEELAQRQANLMNDLQRAFQLQKLASEQVGELRLQLQNAGELRPQDLDTLQRTEMSQREVAGQLTARVTGVAARAEEILSELRGNKLHDPEGERRLGGITAELQRLGEERFPAIEQGLIQSRKLSQTERREGDPSPRDALRNVGDNQADVLDSLRKMLEQMSRWRNEHDASRELTNISRAQEELNAATAEAARQTLTRSAQSLSPQERADLAKLADRQRRNAEQLQQLEQQMRQMAEELAEANPDAAESLREAAEQIRQEAISGRMRETSNQIGDNRMGEASQSQERVLEQLKDVEQTLLNRREDDTEMLVKKLRQAERQLDELRSRQEELLRKLEQASQIADPAEREEELLKLKKEQRQLRDDAAAMVRQMQRLQARKAGGATQRAASRMQQAEDSLQSNNAGDAAANQQEALDDLEQAQRELAQRRREAEEQLAHEQLERIADELRAMIAREQGVIDETRRLQELHQEQGRWKREQLLTLRDLAGTQRALKGETDRLVEKLAAAEVFALALKGAARSMQRATDLLVERKTGADTQQAEEAARQRFVALVDALRQDREEPGAEQQDAQPGAGADGNPGDQGPPADGIPPMAQLRMLITLQQDLNERTVRLFDIRGKNGRLSPAEQQELELLAAEQAAGSAPERPDVPEQTVPRKKQPILPELPETLN